MKTRLSVQSFPVLVFLFLLSGCSSNMNLSLTDTLSYRVKDGRSPLQLYAPYFYVQKADESYNRIGGVVYSAQEEMVVIDPDMPVIYGEQRTFVGDSGEMYTNFIYRVHFQRTPAGFNPFYLGAGENVGLLVIVTVNQQNEPVLYTSLHTCGCYLAFIPTSNLAEERLPPDWPYNSQDIYGETLPAMFEMPENDSGSTLHVLIRDATHRVTDVWLYGKKSFEGVEIVDIAVQPMRELQYIETGNGYFTSFFESAGSRSGYVKNSEKIWERLFISWWALDFRVGEDKYLGQDTDDGPVFYTSLKPWAREASDLRDFRRFLHYWGFSI